MLQQFLLKELSLRILITVVRMQRASVGPSLLKIMVKTLHVNLKSSMRMRAAMEQIWSNAPEGARRLLDAELASDLEMSEWFLQVQYMHVCKTYVLQISFCKSDRVHG